MGTPYPHGEKEGEHQTKGDTEGYLCYRMIHGGSINLLSGSILIQGAHCA